jgi:hypothetical protein
MNCPYCHRELPPEARFCPYCRSLLPSPRTISFSAYIAERTQDFTGREWVFQAIDDWLGDPQGPRVFLLTGEPGCGKTAIAARLAQFSDGQAEPPVSLACLQAGFLSAYHFCSAHDRRWINSHTFTESLALQLAHRYPIFARALTEKSGDGQIIINVSQQAREVSGRMAGVVIEKLDVSRVSAEDAFNWVVREPLEVLLKEESDQPLVFLVDSLDEALAYGGNVGIVQLLSQAKNLPSGVKLLLTSRPETKMLRPIRGDEAIELSLTMASGLDESLKDVGQYVLHILERRSELRDQFVADFSSSAFASAVQAKSEGNFLYVRYLLDMLADYPAKIDQDALDQLPEGLDGIYLDFLGRLVGDQEDVWDETYALIAGILAVARQAVTEGQLTDFVGERKQTVRRRLNALRQFLDVDEALPASQRTYAIYHRSFADLLLDEDRAEEYWCEASEQHRRITNHCLELRDKRGGWDAQDDDGYLFDNLAYHLDALADGDPTAAEELKALFADQEWMKARFEQSNYSYDGYIADLMLAWNHAHAAAQRQTEADQFHTALADCMRYALICTSLNSLAANYVPALVARAVETGLWPGERALSVADRVPDPEERVAMFMALLATNRLGPELRSRAAEAGLAAALVIKDERVVGPDIKRERGRAPALAALAPHLTGQALERGLAAALAIRDEGGRAWALAALAPHLTGQARAQALEAGLAAALANRDEGGRAKALAARALALTGQPRAQALWEGLAAALAIRDEWGRARALAALAPHLTGQALERGLAAALAIRDEGHRARALAALAPHLTGQAQAQALEAGLAAALAIGDEWSRAWALAALAPHLTGQALERGLAAALVIKDEKGRARALAALAPHLVGEARAQALEEGLAAALAIGDERDRAAALAALAPHLTGQALERGLAAALAIRDEWHRAEALAALAPHLTGQARAQALEEGLAAALAIRHESSRAWALAALAPHLTGQARAQTLGGGLVAALAIRDEGGRARALAALAPHLTGQARAQALEEGLAAALAIRHESSRAWALAALAPHLTGQALERGWAAALVIRDDQYRAEWLAALAPNLTGETLEVGLAAALAIGDERGRARALAALAPHLTGQAQAQALEAGLAAALAIRDEKGRARALAALAPHLVGEARAQALEEGLAAALAIGDGRDRAAALAALAPHLVGEARAQALEAGLAAVLAIGLDALRMQALAALAPHLTGQALERGLAAALVIRDDHYQAGALAALAPNLTGEGLEEGLAAALAIRDESSRAWALAALAPNLTGEGLEEGLAAALVIGDKFWRAAALRALAPHLTGEARAQVLVEGLAAALAIRNGMHRARALAALAPHLVDEARPQALKEGPAAALAIGHEAPRTQAMEAFLPVAPDPAAVLRSARQVVADHLLKNLSTATREEVLRLCADQTLFAPPILDQATLAAIAGHIVEVCTQWQWQ